MTTKYIIGEPINHDNRHTQKIERACMPQNEQKPAYLKSDN